MGREEEFESLVRRWPRARKGRGQVVLAVGEPGIGKSRLLQQLQADVGVERHEGIFLQCSPYHEASALYPTIAAFERLPQFAEMGDERRLAALRRHLERFEAGDEQMVGLLAYLLSIKTEDRFPAVNVMDAGQRREQTLRALVDYVCRLAEHAPLLCAFEDVHWANPTTRELLGRLVEAVQSTRTLLIATTRPGFEVGWSDSAHVHVMSLSRLGAEAAKQLLTSAPGVTTLPEDVVGAVLNRADGNQLFIEELTRTVVQSSEAVTGGSAIPATLQDSLMARIDATGTGKPVAQYAAVVGRTFEHALLIETWESDSASLLEGLNALEQAGLLTREGAGELTRFAFKHALIRDAAYDSLLREDRRRLHARVAEAMVSLNPSIRSSQPELLAYHFTVAEEYEAAIDHWLSAGRVATSRAADKEALANLSKGLELLRYLPASPSRDREELSIRVAMIAPTMAAMGQGSQGIQDAVTGALTLSDRIGDTREIFPVLFAHCIFHGHRARHKEAILIARDIDRRAKLQSDVVPRLVAHRVLGFSNLCLGELNTARRELEQIVELYDEDRHVKLTVTYGIDMKSLSLGYLSWIPWYQGTAERALSLARTALQHAQNIRHVISLGSAYWLEGMLAASMHDPGHLRGCSDQLLTLGDEHGVAQWLLLGTGFSAFADLVERADDSAAIRLADHIKARTESGFLCFITLHVAELAARQAEMGRVDDALETPSQAADIVEQGGERLFEAELCRARGLVDAQRNCSELASKSFLRALQIAREQGNRSLELRAATSLARHWSEMGRASEAFQLLQPVYGGFSEGFNAADLKQAKSLLEELK